MKSKLQNLGYALAGTGTVFLMNAVPSFASESTSGLSSVTTAVTTAAGEVKTEGVKVIGAAVGVGIVFWGAKLVWSKFKSMAK